MVSASDLPILQVVKKEEQVTGAVAFVAAFSAPGCESGALNVQSSEALACQDILLRKGDNCFDHALRVQALAGPDFLMSMSA